ncbi:hypothetical protein MMH89_02250 [Candidatus Comchoanobacter bicostacola]|uniref:Uncharacterized protein n=1 Tax=Candidatus Comchoanobacter bicostacola TaxID=2919598 RepID=A0ABY5DMN1_9GAMM|nr:hypothetical protein [Candidatus Comchoanobacter bicostacola]UTC24969.1 hypothetical protein MMH89_02250 [Candidatus Comchoanobacter bicostacola]
MKADEYKNYKMEDHDFTAALATRALIHGDRDTIKLISNLAAQGTVSIDKFDRALYEVTVLPDESDIHENIAVMLNQLIQHSAHGYAEELLAWANDNRDINVYQALHVKVNGKTAIESVKQRLKDRKSILKKSKSLSKSSMFGGKTELTQEVNALELIQKSLKGAVSAHRRGSGSP